MSHTVELYEHAPLGIHNPFQGVKYTTYEEASSRISSIAPGNQMYFRVKVDGEFTHKRYSHSEILESASELVARRNLAVEISESDFKMEIGLISWRNMVTQLVGSTNPIGKFYKSISRGKECVFVDIGNIDRIFC